MAGTTPLDWIRRHVKDPWVRTCEVAGALARGRPLGAAERAVTLPLAGARADFGAVYDLLRDAFAVLLPQPSTLLTVIHDQGKIVRVYLEEVEDGHFVRLIPFQHEGARLEDLPDLGLPKAGWTKTADIRFFDPFHRVGADALEREGLARGLQLLAEAALETIRNGWIDFDPPPRGWRQLQAFARAWRDPVPVPPLPWPRTAHVALVGPHYVSVLRLSAQNPSAITEPAEVGGRYLHAPLSGLPARLRADLGSDIAAAVSARWLFRLADRPALWAASRILAARGVQWEIDPEPMALRRWCAWPVRAALAWPIADRTFGWRRMPQLNAGSLSRLPMAAAGEAVAALLRPAGLRALLRASLRLVRADR